MKKAFQTGYSWATTFICLTGIAFLFRSGFYGLVSAKPSQVSVVLRMCSNEAVQGILMAYLRVQSCKDNLASRVPVLIKGVGRKSYSNAATGFIRLEIKKVRSLA